MKIKVRSISFALNSGLDRPTAFAEFVDWQMLQKMADEWRPLEGKIREVCAQIREAKENSDALPGLRGTLAATLEKLETVIQPLNTELICRLTEGLKKRCACP